MSKEQNPTTHRKKTIAVATVALVLVLGVGAWAISSALKAVSSNKNKQPEVSQNSSADSTDDAKNTSLTDDSAAKTSQEQKSQDQNTQNTQVVAQNTSAQPAAAPSTQYTTNMPTTGPTENFISAIALGLIAALITYNVQLKKKINS